MAAWALAYRHALGQPVARFAGRPVRTGAAPVRRGALPIAMPRVSSAQFPGTETGRGSTNWVDPLLCANAPSDTEALASSPAAEMFSREVAETGGTGGGGDSGRGSGSNGSGSRKVSKFWGGRRESNPQRPEPQSGALPIELLPPDGSIITASRAGRQGSRVESQRRRPDAGTSCCPSGISARSTQWYCASSRTKVRSRISRHRDWSNSAQRARAMR